MLKKNKKIAESKNSCTVFYDVPFLRSIGDFKLVLLLVFASLFYIVYQLYDVLLPFFIGAFLAYIMLPFCVKVQRIVKFRSIASLITITIALLLLGGFFKFVIPAFFEQIKSLYSIISAVNPNVLISKIQDWQIFQMLPEETKDMMNNLIASSPSQITTFLSFFIKQVLNSTSLALETLLIIVIAPFTAFYLLRDEHIIEDALVQLVPKKYKGKTLDIANYVNSVFLSFLKGQIYISLIMCVYYSVTFYLIGLNTAISLGIIVGILSFIPYAGTIIGILLVALIGIIQFGVADELLYVAIALSVGHFAESLYLSPKILGDKLGLYPLVTVMSVLISAHLFGLIGMFFALPLTVLIMMFIKFLVNKYKLRFVEDD